MEQVGPGPLQVGSRLRQVRTGQKATDSLMEVTELVPGKVLAAPGLWRGKPCGQGGAMSPKGRNACITCLVVLIFAASILGACASSSPETGTLEGHVTIGPLVPVVREGEAEPTPAPEVYAAREVVVFEEDGRTEFARVKIDATGNYRVELPAGTYVVDINHLGIDTAAGLPQEIEITGQAVTRLDIDIDTGIR